MVKKISLIVTGIVIIFLATGCIYIKSPEELARRPKRTLEENEIANIIYDFLGDNKTLTLAVNQREEAVRKVDLDKDGANELLILYKKVNNQNQGNEGYGILILKKKEDKWKEINRIVAPGFGFDFLQCEDITGDKRPEIIIGANTESEIEKQLVIYSYHDGYFRDMYHSGYRNFSLGDLDKDGNIEVVLFNKEKDSDIKFIEVLKYTKGGLKDLDKYQIKSRSYYSNMTLGRASNDDIGIFIDNGIGSFNGYTELLIMKNNKLTDVLKNGVYGYYQRLEGNIIGSKDINGDGIIEFGFMTNIKSTEDDYEEYLIPYIKEWYQWNGEKDIVLVRREYYNYDIGYKIVIPPKWRKEFIVLEKTDKSEVVFYSLKNIKELGKEIFSIKSLSIDEWIEEKSDIYNNKEYIVLDKNRERVILGVIQNNSKESIYYIDEEKLKEIFLRI